MIAIVIIALQIKILKIIITMRRSALFNIHEATSPVDITF